ncbi:MAG: class I SAM-dependent methyltransferase [Caulobacteraceae bacterium]
MSDGKDELRYGFGKNWAEFIKEKLSDEIVEDSRRHMAELLKSDSLKGKTFLDIGCGSGIHSLAALRMGAEKIISFDYDVDSVNTTKKVREWAGAPDNWTVFQGSVLDKSLMESIEKVDVVYSWGVLHHTGSMWEAIANAAIPLKPDGTFYIALYSSDNYVDPTPEFWIYLKKRYNRATPLRKKIMELRYVWHFGILPELRGGRNPLKLIRQYGERGMTWWTDVKDWLGGYPMEFASLVETQNFMREKFKLALVNLRTGEGCTEYVFANPKLNEHWARVEAKRVKRPLHGPFQSMGGHGYMVPAPELEHLADSEANPRRSPLIVLEDDQLVGFMHSPHDLIRHHTTGRVSHWRQGIYFSTLDGSDPNSNGRSYSYCIEY